MIGYEYLKVLVEEMHSTTVATMGNDGHPQTRVIDMMYYDEEGVYFLTAKGKAFYKKAVSLRGTVKNMGKKNLDIMLERIALDVSYVILYARRNTLILQRNLW